MARNRTDVIIAATVDALNALSPDASLESMKDAVMDASKLALDLENSIRAKGEKYKICTDIESDQIVQILMYKYTIVNLNMSGFSTKYNEETCVLSVYDEEQGIYLTGDTVITHLIFEVRMCSRSEREMILTALKTKVPVVTRCKDENLIAVNNGILNYRTHELMPFTPELVFTSKCDTNWVPNAPSPTLNHANADGTTEQFEFHAWLHDLMSDNPDMVKLILQVICASLRPMHCFGKIVCLYSESGCSGKSCILSIMRAFLGEGNYSNKSLVDLSKRFGCYGLMGSQAILCDENPVNNFVGSCAEIKAIATGNPILVEGKGKDAYSIVFRGLAVQAFNEQVKFSDKSGSMARRLLVIKFLKCFTGQDKKWIFTECLTDKKLLEHILWYVVAELEKFDEFSIPDECEASTTEFLENNDPIRACWSECLSECPWDVLPVKYAYFMYKSWMKVNNPSSHPVGYKEFRITISELLRNDTEWMYDEKQFRVGNKMVKPWFEIAELNCLELSNPRNLKCGTGESWFDSYVAEKCSISAENGKYARFDGGIFRIAA